MSFLGTKLSLHICSQPEGNLTWPDVYISLCSKRSTSPPLPRLTFAISWFMCFYLSRLIPPILPSPRLPPCAGLCECLKSCGGHLIKNNKASSTHLGQARQRSAAMFAPLQRHRGVENEGRDWQGSENAAEAVEGQGRPSFIAHSRFMLSLLYSFYASHTHTLSIPFCLCLLVATRWQL